MHFINFYSRIDYVLGVRGLAKTISTDRLKPKRHNFPICCINGGICLFIRTVSIYMLLHIAEKEELEEKMSRKGIVSILCQCLCRKNQDLLILVISFLQKLSLYQENIEQMASY